MSTQLSDRLRKSAAVSEAGTALRKIIDTVIVHPVAPFAPLDVEVTGTLAALIKQPIPPVFRKRSAVSGGSGFHGAEMVAEDRYVPKATRRVFAFELEA